MEVILTDSAANEGVVVRRVKGSFATYIPAAEISAPTLTLIYLFSNEPGTGYIFENILITLTNKYSTLYRLQGQSRSQRASLSLSGPQDPSQKDRLSWAGLGLGLPIWGWEE